MDVRMKRILQKLEYMGTTSERTEPANRSRLNRMKVDQFNEMTNSESNGYECALCKNKGVVADLIEDRIVFRDCKCMTIRNCIRKMERSGLKNIIRDYTFRKFIASDAWQESVKAKAQEYARNRSGWFFIGGQSGSGKTHICSAICREFLHSGLDVRYLTWRDDTVRLKSLVNSEMYQKTIDDFKTVKVLFLDDLYKTGRAADGTKQKPTVADINLAFEILNYRYNNPSLLTVISSECIMDDIIEIDEAVAGRIFERAGTNVVNIHTDRKKNYRLKGALDL